MGLRVGIDIGGTKANIGILDETGHILSKRKAVLGRRGTCAEVLELAAEALKAQLAELGHITADVVFCGMGVPGTVSEDGRTARKVPNLGWQDEPCAELFEKLTGIPTALAQDSRAAALGEYLFGAARGRRLVLCVTLGTGIGGGLVLDGKILNGALGGAGEIGHIPVHPGGRVCGCGRQGCVETYTAGRGIERTLKEHPRWAGTGATSETLFALAAQGDADALGVIAEATELLGQALCAVVNTISPDAIIFSGGMCAQRELYVEPVIAYIRSHAYSLSVDDRLLTAVAELGEDSPMVGAAFLDRGSAAK